MNNQSIELNLSMNYQTAKLLREVLVEIGEHQAAGAPIPKLNSKESETIGKLLTELDIKLGGSGRFA